MSIQFILDSQSEADQIRTASLQLIKKYDYLTAADLYDLTGQVGVYLDTKRGWTDFESVKTFRSIDGLSTIMEFPDPSPLDI